MPNVKPNLSINDLKGLAKKVRYRDKSVIENSLYHCLLWVKVLSLLYGLCDKGIRYRKTRLYIKLISKP